MQKFEHTTVVRKEILRWHFSKRGKLDVKNEIQRIKKAFQLIPTENGWLNHIQKKSSNKVSKLQIYLNLFDVDSSGSFDDSELPAVLSFFGFGISSSQSSQYQTLTYFLKNEENEVNISSLEEFLSTTMNLSKMSRFLSPSYYLHLSHFLMIKLMRSSSTYLAKQIFKSKVKQECTNELVEGYGLSSHLQHMKSYPGIISQPPSHMLTKSTNDIWNSFLTNHISQGEFEVDKFLKETFRGEFFVQQLIPHMISKRNEILSNKTQDFINQTHSDDIGWISKSKIEFLSILHLIFLCHSIQHKGSFLMFPSEFPYFYQTLSSIFGFSFYFSPPSLHYPISFHQLSNQILSTFDSSHFLNFGCLTFINSIFNFTIYNCRKSKVSKILISSCLSSWRRYDVYLSGQWILQQQQRQNNSIDHSLLSVETLFIKTCLFEHEKLQTISIPNYKKSQLSYQEMNNKMIGIRKGDEWDVEKLKNCLGDYNNETINSDDIFWISKHQIGKRRLLSNTHITLDFLPSTISTLNSKPLGSNLVEKHATTFLNSLRTLGSLWTSKETRINQNIKIRIRKEAREEILFELLPSGKIPSRYNSLLSIDFENRKYS